MNNQTYQKLLDIRDRRGSGFILLLDPDDIAEGQIENRVGAAIEAGVDAFMVGGSFLIGDNFDSALKAVKAAAANHPVIIFPGSLTQVSPHADAILFLSLVSGRNPEHLIGTQVLAAPSIIKMGLEAISCGYMLIESGKLTSAQFVSNSLPIPRSKPDIALAHALAAQLMGMKTVYLEAGSGAEMTVPKEMIALLSRTLEIPVIVGGGIRTPAAAAEKASAGADFVVIGNFFESGDHLHQMKDFAEAIHQS